MNNRTLAALMGFACFAAGGGALAADPGHDDYNRALLGWVAPDRDADVSGKAAYSASTSNANAAYSRAFFGDGGSSSGQDTTPGKAAYGGTADSDGNARYHGALFGD